MNKEIPVANSQESVMDGILDKIKTIEKHYTWISGGKIGRIIEVRKNYRHRCLEKCTPVKIARQIIRMTQEIIDSLMGPNNIKSK